MYFKHPIIIFILWLSFLFYPLIVSANNSWLSIVVYDLLDETQEVPVKQPDNRAKWDKYNTNIQLVNGKNTLQWQMQDEATHYKVTYRINNGDWIEKTVQANTFIIDENLIGALEFRIIGCKSSTICLDYSNEISSIISRSNSTIPSYISIPKLITPEEGFRISWSAVEQAHSYTLQRNTQSNEYETVFQGMPLYGSSNYSFDQSPLGNGSYCYRIKANIDSTSSSYSSPVCIKIGNRELQSPSLFTAIETQSGIYQLNWESSPHAASYKLERESHIKTANPLYDISSRKKRSSKLMKNTNVSSTAHWKQITKDLTTSISQVHTIDTFDLNGLQNYRIAACDINDKCTQPKHLSYHVPVEKIVNGVPTNAYAIKNTNNIATISWNAVPKADSYIVRMYREGSAWERIYSGITKLTTDITLRLSGSYHFSVEACIDAGFCGKTVQLPETLTFVAPGTPSSVPSEFIVPSYAESNSQYQIKWLAPVKQGVSKYEVVGELKGILAKRQFDLNANDTHFTLTRSALAEGREYCYKVRAWFNDGIIGDYTPTQCILIGTKAFDAVSNFKVTQLNSQDFQVSWNSIPNAKKYLLEQVTSASTTIESIKWQAIYYGSETVVNQKYSEFHKQIYQELGSIGYRVSACNTQGICGDHMRVYYSNIVENNYIVPVPSEHKAPSCIDVPNTVNKGSSITINWCASQANNVYKYELLGELAGIINSGLPNSLTRTEQGLFTLKRPPLPEGKHYCYKVRTVFKDGSASSYSEKKCTLVGKLAFKAPEVFLSIMNPNYFNQYQLAWSSNNNADSYLLEIQTTYGNWEEVICNKKDIQLDGKLLRGCTLSLKEKNVIPELGKVIFRVSSCNADNICGDYKRTNLELTPFPTLFEDNSGNLLFKTIGNSPGGISYILLSKQGSQWKFSTLTEQEWINRTINLDPVDKYKLEFGLFSGDSYEDIQIINIEGTIEIILQGSQNGYTYVRNKIIKFIHTDLLGSPVTETNL